MRSKLLLIIALLLAIPTANADYVFVRNTDTIGHNTATLQGDAGVIIGATGGYLFPMHGGVTQAVPPTLGAASAVQSQWVPGRIGTLSNLTVVQLAESQAGDLVAGVRVNGVATALTVTIT